MLEPEGQHANAVFLDGGELRAHGRLRANVSVPIAEVHSVEVEVVQVVSCIVDTVVKVLKPSKLTQAHKRAPELFVSGPAVLMHSGEECRKVIALRGDRGPPPHVFGAYATQPGRL